jgi:methyltransferase
MMFQDTSTVYSGLVVLIALQRGAELLLTRRNQQILKAQGSLESGAGHYPWMVLMHVLFLLACPLEVVLLQRPFVAALAYPMLGLLMLATLLRVWTIKALGRRWTARVFTLKGVPRIVNGPYRYVGHPNYLAVVVEIVALPLIHSAWFTAIIFSILNALLLRVRIRLENVALARAEEGA